MKWFKHDTNASDDVRIVRLEEKYGNDGYSAYFKLLEIVGREGEKGKISFKKFPKNLVSKRTNLEQKRLDEILTFMGYINLCCSKSLKRDTLYFPKFKDRADDYTKRLRRVSEHSTENVPLDKNRIDKIRREYIQAKGWDEKNLVSNDYARITVSIKNLLQRTDDDTVIEAIKWIKEEAEGKYNWTLETLHNKKWHDFLNRNRNRASLPAYYKEMEPLV